MKTDKKFAVPDDQHVVYENRISICGEILRRIFSLLRFHPDGHITSGQIQTFAICQPATAAGNSLLLLLLI